MRCAVGAMTLPTCDGSSVSTSRGTSPAWPGDAGDDSARARWQLIPPVWPQPSDGRKSVKNPQLFLPAKQITDICTALVASVVTER